MNRRDFHTCLAATAGGLVGLGATTLAHAQAAPVEGQHFVRLSTPASVNLPADKKIEMIEFFWYGCPACNAFEPTLDAWLARLPPDVAFRRVHVGFTPMHQVHQKLFYTLEETGQLEALHKRVFAAIHKQSRRLINDSDIAAFFKEAGADGDKLMTAFKGFSVNNKANRARQLTEAYKIDGVPSLGLQGRFYTSASLPGVGNHERMLQVAEGLIQRIRRG